MPSAPGLVTVSPDGRPGLWDVSGGESMIGMELAILGAMLVFALVLAIKLQQPSSVVVEVRDERQEESLRAERARR